MDSQAPSNISADQWANWLADPCAERLMETIRREIRHWLAVIDRARTDAYDAFPNRLTDVERFALVAMEAQGAVMSLRGIAAAIDAQRVNQATEAPGATTIVGYPRVPGMGAQ